MPTGFFFPKMEVAENSLSEPHMGIFSNHFKTVDMLHFKTVDLLYRLLGLIFGFPSFLVPMLKSINLMYV